MTVMGIRWKYYEMKKGVYTQHAIYAREFDEASGKYLCLNSWGEVEEQPEVDKSEVEAVYLISLMVLD